MSARRERHAALPPPLPADLVERPGAGPQLDPDDLEQVLVRTDGLATRLPDGGAARVTTAVVAAAAAARLALDGRLTDDRAQELVAAAALESRISEEEARVHVFLRVLLEVMALAPSAVRALDGLLGALAAFAPAEGVRLDKHARGVRDALGDAPPDSLEIPVPGTDAVLVVHSPKGSDVRCRAFAEETARILPMILRASGDSRSGEGEKLEAAQRRLRRLALDLHDGPAQDVTALAADTALLAADLAEDVSPERLAAAGDLAVDIRDRLSALGRDIRDLAEVLEPRAMLREPIHGILATEAASFARRSGITPTVDVGDDLGIMTASQQIALVRVAQEALTNVREHAAATAVHVSARATAQGVSLVVEDNGRGFDVDKARLGGRLGLAGMHERVRLLGGRLTIESGPGGPTRVEATIPRWRPSGPSPRAASAA